MFINVKFWIIEIFQMKNLFYIILLAVFVYSCASTKTRNLSDPDNPYNPDSTQNDTVRIANDSLEYEIVIIEPGFSYFLHSEAHPKGYYSLPYLENKNRFLVTDYNQRVNQSSYYNSNIYTQEINYDPNINYGYEVNYQLYNYFVFLSSRYGQNFSVPTRI